MSSSRSDQNQRFSFSSSRGGAPPGGNLPFNSPPAHFQGGNYGAGLRGMPGYSAGGSSPQWMAGQKRTSDGFPVSAGVNPHRGGSPDSSDGGNYAKLFIGSVPRTITEEDIRPVFEDYGNVLEVALIKDKRTGQQQGCCFIKYATAEEADRAIRGLHNQLTLPEGFGPIQVRYADGERERLGAVEYKLFVGSLNKQATEKEVEEIFSRFGHVEDVYIMRDELKQSRGCGFVKFSHRDMAAAAINGLNGTFVMRGCDQPLTVRFADPKRPKAGDSRGGPAFGGPGFGSRSQVPLGVRPMPNLGPVGGRIPPNAWQPMSPQGMGPSSQAGGHAFGGSPIATRGGISVISSSSMVGSLGVVGDPTNGSLQGQTITPSSSQQSFRPSLAQIPTFGQQISPLQKPLHSPQNMPALQLQQIPTSYSLAPSSQALPSQQIFSSTGQHSFGQALPSQQLFGLSGRLSVSQPQIQQVASSTVQQVSLNGQQQSVSAAATRQQLTASSPIQQQLLQPQQQSQAQQSQVLLQQQTQSLQSNIQSQQQAFSQLQQQSHLTQPSSQGQSQPQTSQPNKLQPPWTGITPQTIASTPAIAPVTVSPSTSSAAPVVPITTQPPTAPITCNWTEHTSPEGYKYYYNSVTNESKWEKPEELTAFEQQQQQQQQQQPQPQQQPLVQQLQSQPQAQSLTVLQPTQLVSQVQQLHPQAQLRQQQQFQLQQPALSLSYPASGLFGHQNIQGLGGYAQLQASNSVIDPSRIQQGLQAAQEWMWKNKPAGT